MHGVTKRVAFPVNCNHQRNRELRAAGEAKLKQSDFGMKPFEKGLGLIKIGDETESHLHGRRQNFLIRLEEACENQIRRIAIITVSLLALTAQCSVEAQEKSRTYTDCRRRKQFLGLRRERPVYSARFAHDHEIGVKSFSGKIVVPETGAGKRRFAGTGSEHAITGRARQKTERRRQKEDFQLHAQRSAGIGQASQRSPSNPFPSAT